jgi:hypothetical protein
MFHDLMASSQNDVAVFVLMNTFSEIFIIFPFLLLIKSLYFDRVSRIRFLWVFVYPNICRYTLCAISLFFFPVARLLLLLLLLLYIKGIFCTSHVWTLSIKQSLHHKEILMKTYKLASRNTKVTQGYHFCNFLSCLILWFSICER